jgi:hypothetical protein
MNIICPNHDCGFRGDFVFNGTYKRYYITLCDGQILEEFFYVQVIKCRRCGKSHALLPSFLVPYLSYTNTFIIMVLAERYINKLTISDICNKYQINPTLFYQWIKRFNKDKVLASIVLQIQSNKPKMVLDTLLTLAEDQITVFLKNFYSAYTLMFLQIEMTRRKTYKFI